MYSRKVASSQVMVGTIAKISGSEHENETAHPTVSPIGCVVKTVQSPCNIFSQNQI